jgi:outer membrane protein assembly factor BamD
VADTYPQYSHMDDVLLGLGDAYEAEAKYVRGLKLPEAGKARLEKIYDDQAIAAYSKIVTEHAASRGVEDAKDRLVALHADIPKPTAEQLARSEELENSRASYKVSDRMSLLIMHKPDVVTAARTGDPTLEDPKPTIAPDVTRKIVKDFQLAMNPNAARPAAATGDTTGGGANGTTIAPVTDGSGVTAPAAPAAPLALQDVSTADTSTGASGSTMTVMPVTSGGGAPAASAGIEIVGTGSGAGAPVDGMKAKGPTDSTPLPPIEKPADAPDTVNDIQPGQAPPAAAAPANGKKAKPEFDKNEESSNKHKKKKGLAKINPF